jgi:transcriptional regulator NrdR family protein
MKCPKCKKPSELQTKRTMANGREVTRERFCPKCKDRFITIERFDTDIADSESRYQRKIDEQERQGQALQSRLDEYGDLFRGLKMAMDQAGKNDR